MAYQFALRTGRSRKPKFLSLQSAYHGDTVGAVSLGHIDLFHKAYGGLLFKTDIAPAPYCYRCPFNRARPERADARLYRQCQWECTAVLEQKFAAQRRKGEPYAAFVFEPLIQGAAGMVPQPDGWLRRAARIARRHGALLLADEVLTGFGRTGPTFACQKESVAPDLMALAKGMTGGYLPMAATLATRPIFNAFLGRYDEFKTFFHGHSFTANQLGAAASLASLRLLQSSASLRARNLLQNAMAEALSDIMVPAQRRRHPPSGPDRRRRVGPPLEDAPALRAARSDRRPRLRSYGPAGRPHPPRRQRHRPHAPLLRHPGPSEAHGRRSAPERGGSVRFLQLGLAVAMQMDWGARTSSSAAFGVSPKAFMPLQ